jgi:cytidylate kinase
MGAGMRAGGNFAMDSPESETSHTSRAGFVRIAIDGPAGSGKSTIGERVARRLGYLYVDTGAFYRAMTLVAERKDVSPDDADALTALAQRTHIEIVAPTQTDGRQYTVLVNGEDVTLHLRETRIEERVSQVARHDGVRAQMRRLQRAMGDHRNVVMVGRDIGSVVLPDADLKIYLDPSLEERARRRHRDLVASLDTDAPSYETVLDEIRRRDDKDAKQLQIPADAVRIDTSHAAPEETVQRVLELVRERLGRAPGDAAS